ncbi:hypothetical protein E0Z10_g7614 [Xylaria hypoxylon]|uniref:Uncharacterized protein n=1 Tax=Xylaria hypoxylon TaxID=37992 RepID=A0A4Z0YQ85_9PEZI|nr:hypothetical protein E0Z10_g7614 [Xylaria hypoxylon]
MATNLPTNNLKRKASRWQTLPPLGEDTSAVDTETEKYSLLLFLRDLDASPQKWDDFIEGLKNSPGSIDETSTISAVLEAALETQMINHDYISPANPNASDTKRRRLDLYGNGAAGGQIAEYDELINLARVVWSDPDDIRNTMGEVYQSNLGQQPGDPNFTLDKIFHLARCWAEVRYRYMNHSLRDDPSLYSNYNKGRTSMKGNAANAMVHESSVLLDATVVQFLPIGGIGYNADDRGIFQELYLLTPKEGRQLVQYTGQSTGLRIGLPQVFDYIVHIINAYMNWRVRVLESARRVTLSSPAYRNANNQAAKANILANSHQASGSRIQAVDNIYAYHFVPALRVLLEEAGSLNAFVRLSFTTLENATGQLIASIKVSGMNTATPDLRFNVQFNRMVNQFPGQGRTLMRPTGTSLLASR